MIEIEQPESAAMELGPHSLLAIGDNIFFALNGASDPENGTSGAMGEERHFLVSSALNKLGVAPTLQ